MYTSTAGTTMQKKINKRPTTNVWVMPSFQQQCRKPHSRGVGTYVTTTSKALWLLGCSNGRSQKHDSTMLRITANALRAILLAAWKCFFCCALQISSGRVEGFRRNWKGKRASKITAAKVRANGRSERTHTPHCHTLPHTESHYAIQCPWLNNLFNSEQSCMSYS